MIVEGGVKQHTKQTWTNKLLWCLKMNSCFEPGVVEKIWLPVGDTHFHMATV